MSDQKEIDLKADHKGLAVATDQKGTAIAAGQKGLALVTGASGALGAAIALRLSGMGYDLGLHYHTNRDKAEKVREAIAAKGGRSTLYQADLAEEKELVELFAGIERDRSDLTVLVNNAACLIEHPLFFLDRPDIEKITAINQWAAYYCLKAASRMMCRNGKGYIVNIGSLSEHLPLMGQIGYSMSKAALTGLTRSAAMELSRFGITVNSVTPGPLAGDGLAAGSNHKPNGAGKANRIPGPEDVAACVGFLCSGDAGFITGQSIIVDGGLSLTSSVTYSANI